MSFFNSRIKYFSLQSTCLEIENELKFITIILLLSFCLVTFSSESVVLQNISRVITVLSLCLSAVLLKYIVNLSPKHNVWEHNGDSYAQALATKKKAIRKNEIQELILLHIPNHSNIEQRLFVELDRIGKMSSLSSILELRFAPPTDAKTTYAYLSYKRLQDNSKAKMLLNGFVFCGKALEVRVGKEVEVDFEASATETRHIGTQTWIIS